jgi:NitT/TauT family transport system ATP-binding protein
MAEVILEAINLCKAYPMRAGSQLTVLEDINLTVKEGEFISILGPSGAGKSTLLRILSGLIKPTSGKILYHGKPQSEANPSIAMVFQSFALFPWLTVLENVEVGLKAKGVERELAREKAIKMLDLVGLDGFEDAYPRELSGGMKQRVGIARALAIEPEILFMDEPFSALDILTADNLRNELIRLWMERKLPIKSIIFVTHNIEEAVFLSDRAVILSHNPATIRAEITINMPHVRNKNLKEFKLMVDDIFAILTRPKVEAPFMLRKERYQFLPHAKVGAIAGLLELVLSKGGIVDISELTSDLGLEVDDVFPLIEAAAFLGFASVKEGDIKLTDVGFNFSRSDLLEKKVIFREMALKNIQLINQIYQVLTKTEKKRMSEDFFIEILENHFTKDEAWNQLEIAIDWGRYAELFAYDYDSGELYIEETEGDVTQKKEVMNI